ncbi:hypothetical protein OKA04_05890 [Luteolibacter flavescens]|uniref:Cytochrome c domain-containing protein n=1 Tax=Luteolibacter flavescens TaxID=1859460 RepID=A0ABT3FM33_9BACT|nr:hypothetical protein [Luteolibacter flavescens]MCW1884254.1 hypothetical protein [Luteolibacter flavescens]
MRSFLLLLALAQGALAEADFWDLPPIRYSDTKAEDSLAKLAADLESGARRIEGTTPLERLKFVLRELKVPEESQMMVFSKTSHQNPLIHPKNPRALYFSENAYVGYVPGGVVEAVVQDPVLGPVFYTIDTAAEQGMKIQRDLSNCLSCHGTTRTEGVPGLQVRSVFPDVDGHPILPMGTSHVNHDTPLAERWGGYYVTGRSSLPHLGNRTYVKGGDGAPRASDLADLSGLIDAAKYPQATSDIVALMVLEHQCRMHNLLTAATLQYRRAHFLSRAFDSQSDPDAGSAGRVADGAAEKIAAHLFFKDEADPGEGIAGGEAFQKMFEGRFPRAKNGDSLVDFQLYSRVFKNRCSYMVYSDAFRDLPPRVKSAVIVKMKSVLAGEDPAFGWLGETERKRITGILSETLPGWQL